jgi:hypothetical protein
MHESTTANSNNFKHSEKENEQDQFRITQGRIGTSEKFRKTEGANFNIKN